MYKYGFSIMFFIVIVFIIHHINIVNDKKYQIDLITQQLDGIIYEYKVKPIINWIKKNPSFEYYTIASGSGSFPGISNEDILIFKGLFLVSGIEDISNFNHNNTKKIQISFGKKINKWAYNCIYLYGKDEFKNRGEVGQKKGDVELFELFGSKFASNKLIKINDDYAKYCTSPFFY